MNTLVVEIPASQKEAKTCKEALELEAKGDTQNRSEITITYDKDSLVLRIEAQDLTALRAAMNTYLRWADMCLQITEKR